LRYIIFISILTLVVSCSIDSKKGKLEEIDKVSSLVTGLKCIKMESRFFEKTTFLNGDPIKQAQTSIEWKNACKNKVPAWCYADSKLKKGILYNYYVISDSRRIAPKSKYLTKEEIEMFEKELTDNPKSIKFNWSKGSSIERSFVGTNYDLKFVNFWIKNDTESYEKVNVAVIDQKTNKLKIESVSPNNGYRIWLKK
jgi:hypothetical protein